MGTYVFKLPDVGDVMTDKATVEMTSPVSGKVLAMHGEPGEMAPVGAPLVELEVEGAGNVDGKAPPVAKPEPAKQPAAPPAPAAPEKKTAEKETPAEKPKE